MQTVRWIIYAIVFVALLFISLQNADTVTLRIFNVANLQAPLIFVVLIAFAVGVAAGLLAGALRASRLKRQLSKLQREQRGPTPGSAPAPVNTYPHHDGLPDVL